MSLGANPSGRTPLMDQTFPGQCHQLIALASQGVNGNKKSELKRALVLPGTSDLLGTWALQVQKQMKLCPPVEWG